VRRVFIFFVAAVLLGGGGARSDDDPLVFTSSVEMVRLDVAVTHNGRAVKDLTGRHFEVKDNGVLQQVEIVGHVEKPVHAVLALDNSGSLAGDRMARLKIAAHALLDVLGPDDAVSLLTFSSRLELKAGPGAPREQVHAVIEATEARLSTSLYDATFAALTVADPTLGRPVVLVFTDGQDVGSWLRPGQVLHAARSSDLVSHAVVSGQAGSDTLFLEELARATGGEVWKVEHLELEDAFLQALEEFRSRYTLQYAVQGDDQETWHDIDVRVRIPGARVLVREGYLRRGTLP
jgi:VWFA-related protein